MNSWAVQGKDFKIGDKTSEGLPSFLSETRSIFFEPSSPFIYMPGADFVKFARELQVSYSDQGIRCTYDNTDRPSLSSSCRFEKPCSEVQSTEDDLFQMTVFDDNGQMDLRLEGKDMFVPGTQIDASDPTIADWCFVPILKHD